MHFVLRQELPLTYSFAFGSICEFNSRIFSPPFHLPVISFYERGKTFLHHPPSTTHWPIHFLRPTSPPPISFFFFGGKKKAFFSRERAIRQLSQEPPPRLSGLINTPALAVTGIRWPSKLLGHFQRLTPTWRWPIKNQQFPSTDTTGHITKIGIK